MQAEPTAWCRVSNDVSPAPAIAAPRAYLAHWTSTKGDGLGLGSAQASQFSLMLCDAALTAGVVIHDGC